MSERQARIRRKSEAEEVKTVKKKSKAEIITNVVICVAVVAVLGLGGWAVASKYQNNAAQTQAEADSQDISADAAQQSVPTIEEYAQSLGMTGEEFIKEYGLDSNEEVTPYMEMTLATEYMTLANYAKMIGSETAEVRESMGIDDTFADDTLMGEIFAAQADVTDGAENADSDTADGASEDNTEATDNTAENEAE